MAPEQDERGPQPAPRYIEVVHTMPGRVRFRLSWLHDARRPEEVTRLADDLSHVPGMREVEIRPYTGTVLCVHDPERLSHGAILAEIVRLTGVDTTIRLGERPPARELRPGTGPGVVAREVARFFRHLDDKVLTATDGKLDMGTLATFGFLGAGALNVALRRQASAPPWFNLAWWGVRTFMLFEADAVADPDGD